MSTLGTVGRGRYTPLNSDSTKNPERLLALRGQKGATWFVDSGVSASGNGLSWGGALETIAEAIAKALAGDLVLVAEGHAESTAVAITQSVAGVHIVGLGVGDRRPVITFTADVDWNLNAAGLVLENLVIKNNFDSQAIVVEINAADCQVRYCELREGASTQFLVGIDVGGTAANAADGTKIIGCSIYGIAAGANSAIKLSEISDVTVIQDCVIDGDFADAGIHNPTGFILTNLLLQDNIVRNRQTGDHAIEVVSACTGVAVGNRLFADTIGVVFDPGSLFCAGNMEGSAIDSVGGPSPAGGNYNPVLGWRVEKAEDGATAVKDVLFTVTGLVLITSWIGQVTNALGATTKFSDYVLGIDGAGTLCAATDISSAAIGYTFQLGGDAGATLLAASSYAVSVVDLADNNAVGAANRIVGRVGLGTTSLAATRTVGDSGDAITHIIHYWPLEAGARVVAAA